MSFCTRCGTRLTDEQDLCPTCGAPNRTADSAPAYDDTQPAYTAPEDTAPNHTAPGSRPQFSSKITDRTAEFDKNDIYKNNVFAVLAYLSWLVLIPILCAKDSAYAKFHANQGLVLTIASTALGVITGIIRGVLGLLVNATGSGFIAFVVGLIELVLALPSLALGILAIMGIVFAAQGKAKELPFVGKFRILK